MTTRSELRQRGEGMRARLLGDDAQACARGDTFLSFRDLLSETEFGTVWSRPGLALPDRMVCTLAALASAQRLPWLRRYVGAALNVLAALSEVLARSAHYESRPTPA